MDIPLVVRESDVAFIADSPGVVEPMQMRCRSCLHLHKFLKHALLGIVGCDS